MDTYLFVYTVCLPVFRDIDIEHYDVCFRMCFKSLQYALGIAFRIDYIVIGEEDYPSPCFFQSQVP